MDEQQFRKIAEEFIDANGLAATLQAIANVCYEKGEHIRTNWQDKKSAKAWDKAAERIESATRAPAIVSICP